MKTYIVLLLASQIALHAAPAPAKPPPAKAIATNAAPAAALGPLQTIKLDNGVIVTVAWTNKFTLVQLRRWLHDAATRTP